MINLNHVGVSDHTVDLVLTYGTNYHMVKKTIFCDHKTVWDHLGENHMEKKTYGRQQMY